MKKSLENAEKRARMRDDDNEKVLSDDEIKNADYMQRKADENGMKLVPKKKYNSKVKFAQILQINIRFLREKNYLTTAEKNFIFDISPNVQFLSNCIVDDINLKSPTPATQTDISSILGKRKQNVNPIINNLIDKGILARSESSIDNNNVRAYALFINPHIILSGDKTDVNETLKAMFKKSMKQKVLKDLPQKLW